MINRVILILIAVVLGTIGVGAAVVPAAFYSSFGIEVAGNPGLASELRGTGVVMLLLGLCIAAGAVWTRWAFPSAVVALVVSLGYAVGRGLSAIADGVPSPALIGAAVVELLLAAAAAWVATRTRPTTG